MKESNISLYPDQEEFIQEIRSLWKGHKRILGVASTGFGKCFGVDTPILMFNGEIKPVQEVKAGDFLMGPDSKPRVVKSLARGREDLFKIKPKKGTEVVVNRPHILSLRISGSAVTDCNGVRYEKGDICNISVDDYLKCSKTFRHCAKWWRTGVDYSNSYELEIPPYMLGVWLGDGTCKEPAVTTADEVIERYIYDYAQSLGCYVRRYTKDGSCNTLSITRGRGQKNPFLDMLRAVGVFDNKHIPHKYKTASRADRLELLAAIIDTDGYLAKGACFDIVLKQERFAEDVCYLARSLGFAAYTNRVKKGIKSTGFVGEYSRICISGDTHLIPTRLKNKSAQVRRQKKNVLVCGFDIEPTGKGDYYGFEVVGPDRLFLLGDFSVVHNTRCAARIIEGCVNRGMRVCFIVPRISLIEQTARSFYDLGLTDITYLWGGYDTDYSARITIASVDTYIRRQKMNFDLVIVDEVQHRRKTLLEWMNDHPEERYIGLTATAFADWLGTYYTAMAKSKSMAWLMENKRLAPYDVFVPSKPNLKGLKTSNTSLGIDYKESDLEEIMCGAKIVGDVVGNWLQHGENRLTIALCVNISHAGHLTNEFNRVGVKAELISHHVPVYERELVFKRALDGITRVILSVDCLTEGFDMPEATCLINARPTKSKERFIQGIGRILRFMPNKRALIFDHAASFLDPDLGFVEHIEVEDLCSKSDGLDEVAKARKEKEKTEKKPIECKKCTYLKPAGVLVCPKCGHKPIAGENIEVDEERELVALRKSKVPTKEEKQQFYSELCGYRNERKAAGKNYSDGWIAHKFKAKYGEWPSGLALTPLEPSISFRGWIKNQNIRYAKGKAKGDRALKELKEGIK